MGRIIIHKRRFLRLLGFVVVGIAWSHRWKSGKGGHGPDWFYVAGVRFNKVCLPPGVNDPVRLYRRDWCGHSCYEIQTENHERIGYVPHRYVYQIGPVADRDWRICGLDRYGVPWKRYKVGRVS